MMRAIASYLIRLVAYAIVLGLIARAADFLWVSKGLDDVIPLQPLHDNGELVLVLAPIVLALIGVGALRPVAVFLAAFLIGAALTAPFAFARLAGA